MAEIDAASRIRRAYADAITAHANARMAHAESFLRFKMMGTPDVPVTDRQAEARAVIETQDAQSRTENLLHLARLEMEKLIYGQEPTETRTELTH